jgi:ParB family transcriptional regulator, chromosome partitioning protein
VSKTSQKNRPRLGRGLSSLISVSDLPVEAEVGPSHESEATSRQEQLAPHSRVGHLAAAPSADHPTQPLELPIDAIAPNPHQPRRSFDEASLAELAGSIRSSGLIQPIIVRKIDGGHQLIAGERRLRAAKQAGLTTIPAIVRDVDSFTQAQMALIENIQREDLNPVDRALGYKALITQLGLTQSELAGRLGEDRSSIANYLRLLDLSEPVREKVRSGELTLGHAKILAGVPDILEQQRLADLVVSQGLSVRNLERLLNDGPKTPTPRESSPSAHLQDLERSLSRQLGMRVQVRSGSSGKGRGKLILHYASLDQFDELLGRMGVSVE